MGYLCHRPTVAFWIAAYTGGALGCAKPRTSLVSTRCSSVSASVPPIRSTRRLARATPAANIAMYFNGRSCLVWTLKQGCLKQSALSLGKNRSAGTCEGFGHFKTRVWLAR